MALDEQQKQAVRAAFAERVKQLRKQTGLPQDRFALEHGQHRTWIGHLERGSRAPTLYSLIELAKAFDLSPSELLDGVDWPGA